MKIISTTLYDKTVKALSSSKILVSYGGSSSGKTICALTLLTMLANRCNDLEIALIGRSIPVIKRNLLKDWKRVVMREMFDSNRFNATDLIYTFPTGSKFRFISADDPSKFLGYRCDYFLMDEANYMQEAVFTQLFMRLAKRCIITFNPSKEFWIKRIMTMQSCYSLHSTYKDNEYCSQDIAENLEALKEINENFYNVYCLGQWGSVEGRVFEKFNLIDELPAEFDAEYLGGDFGWNHPSVIVHLRFKENNLYIDEVLYSPKQQPEDLAAHVRPLGNILGYYDSASPGTIVALNQLGCAAVGFNKKDGVMHRVRGLLNCNIFITKRSTNTLKEFSNYCYTFDKLTEKYIDYPVDKDNHAIDAVGYGATDYIYNNIIPTQYVEKPEHNPWNLPRYDESR